MMFRVILCIQFYRLMQLIFSTLLKGIIRKECQSFTNHGHAKTPPTVFNPLSLWLTLPRDMGVSHTQWPSSVTRAILACLWFAQGSKKSKQQSHSYEPVVCTGFAQGSKKNQSSRTVLWCSGWFYVFNFIDWCNLFFHVTKSNKGKSKCGGTLPGRGHKSARCRWNRLRRSSSGGDCNVYESHDADNHQDSRERSSVVPEVTPTRSGSHATHSEVLRTLGWSVLWPKALRKPNVTTSKRGKWTWTPQL